MMHPDTELRKVNDIVGYGVFATKPIPKGTIVYVKDALEIEVSAEQFEAMDPQYQKIVDWFSWIDARGCRIVSWDIGKYVNHSCKGNCISTGFGFEIATRDIAVGEEITDEYGIFNLPYSLKCCCGSENCRQVITSDDWGANYRAWNKLAVGALKYFGQVVQPLVTYMEAGVYRDLMNYLNTNKRYPSILRHRWCGEQGVKAIKA
jgi:uncharacterized protein